MSELLELGVTNYKSLANAVVRLGRLNVLVGPNEAGKSNLLDVVAFLGDSARLDLAPAIAMRGGFDRLRFRGVEQKASTIEIRVKALVTANATLNAPDEYKLTFWERAYKTPTMKVTRDFLIRREEFAFKRKAGRGRRITIRGMGVAFLDELSGERTREETADLRLRRDLLGLASLPRLAPDAGGREVERFARLFLGFRVVDIDVSAARRPSVYSDGTSIQADASNLSAYLWALSRSHEDVFASLMEDARALVPGLSDVTFRSGVGPSEGVTVELLEKGLSGATRLAEASFGTIRILALLAVLHDPEPAPITVIEELDHGLHPYVFDRMAELLRDASERTQLLLATHSPALVNRLRPEELIVCERDFVTGGSRIPAIKPEDVRAMEEGSGGELRLGELWFSGQLGGVPG